jgi:hypothetical protein
MDEGGVWQLLKHRGGLIFCNSSIKRSIFRLRERRIMIGT